MAAARYSGTDPKTIVSPTAEMNFEIIMLVLFTGVASR
jgi:hypothetical protein